MRTKYIISIGILAIILVIIIASTISIIYLSLKDETKITVYPIVNSSGNVYNISNTHLMGYQDIHESFAVNYSKTAISELQLTIIDFILEEAKRIGEDPIELEECLNLIGYIKENEAWHIPCYIEKANLVYHFTSDGRKVAPGSMLYENEEYGPLINETCWIVVMNVGGKTNMGHIEIYYISIEKRSIIYEEGCD